MEEHVLVTSPTLWQRVSHFLFSISFFLYYVIGFYLMVVIYHDYGRKIQRWAIRCHLIIPHNRCNCRLLLFLPTIISFISLFIYSLIIINEWHLWYFSWISGVSERAEEILGYPSSELLGEDIEIIFDKKKHDIKTTLKEMFLHGEPGVLIFLKKKQTWILIINQLISGIALAEEKWNTNVGSHARFQNWISWDWVSINFNIYYYSIHYDFIVLSMTLFIHVLILGCDVISYVNEATEMLDKALNFQAIFATVSEAVIVCSNVCFFIIYYFTKNETLTILQEGQIQMINDKALKLFGYSDDVIKGKSIDFLLPHQGNNILTIIILFQNNW